MGKTSIKSAAVTAGIDQALAEITAVSDPLKLRDDNELGCSWKCELNDGSMASLCPVSEEDNALAIEKHVANCKDSECTVADEKPGPFVSLCISTRLNYDSVVISDSARAAYMRHTYTAEEAFKIGCRFIAASLHAAEGDHG